MDIFWHGGLLLGWLFFSYRLVVGRVKWFWFLIWVTYTLIAISLFIFLEVGNTG